MTPTLLLLDATPLRDLAQGRTSGKTSGHIVHDTWLRDRCVFSPISLLTDHKPSPEREPGLQNAERLRAALLALGLIEVNISWDTLRESARFAELPPFSHAWLLAGLASHLDATLVTDCPLLLRPLAGKLRTLAWDSQNTNPADHNDAV